MTEKKISSKRQATVKRTEAASLDEGQIHKRLSRLQPVIKRIIDGDFTSSIDVPQQKDSLTDVMTALHTMQEVIRGQQEEIRILNQQLHTDSSHHSRALEEAQALTHLGSWEWDIKTDVISWSDELYRIYGMKPQERAIGFEEFIRLIHPDDREQVQSIIYNAFHSGQPFEFEHRIILPDGAERILKGMGKQIKDKDGNPERMLGTSQDVTLAKQLDRAKDEFISIGITPTAHPADNY